MRILTLVAALALSLSFIAIMPDADAAPRPATPCSDVVHESCGGWICVDDNFNGRFEWDECEPRYCTCDPQPTPW